MKLKDVLRAANKSPVEQERVKLQQLGSEAGQRTEEIRTLPIGRIKPNPYQPRVNFDKEGLDELAKSIAEHGVLHPIVVREIGDDYQLIIGERRLRACEIIGWKSIPAIIRNIDDKLAAEMALIENLQRRDLHFFEEAEGYEQLIQKFSLTQEQLAQRIGKSQPSIANRIRLLKLDKELRDIISREMISERHTRSLLKLDTKEEQLDVLRQIIKHNLNVRRTEELIANRQKRAKQEQKVKKIIFKDIRLFTNSVKKLTKTLTDSGLSIDYQEEENDSQFKVTVVINKPERGEQ